MIGVRIVYNRVALMVGILMLAPLVTIVKSHAHGGIPGVIALIPSVQSSEPFWVIDTLGLFRGEAGAMSSESSDRREWSWLCDDAVDPMLGVDDLVVVDSQTLIAVARSGVYRSTDGGCSFVRLDSQINEHTIGGISAHPLNQQRLTIFTNSVGTDNRVWWSDDKGETWTPSNLLIEGGIFGMWRDPINPNDIWINHATGVSRSQDGGQTFTTLNEVSYSGASPYEVRLLGGGYLGQDLVLWASLNHYPTSSLLISLDEGQTWREIHSVNDSYDQLALTTDALWVSTPFEGLFVYPLSDAERQATDQAWKGGWREYHEIFVSCLTPDPLNPSALWACGRSNPTKWVVGRTEDMGESWSILMESYQEAAGGNWGCAVDQPSLIACSTRCLAEGCDPSLNMTLDTTEDIENNDEMNGGNDPQVNEMNLSSIMQDQRSTSPNSGCQLIKRETLIDERPLLLLLIMGLLCALKLRTRQM